MRWAVQAIAAAVLAVALVPAEAQSVSRESFRVRSNSGTVEQSCGFNVVANLGSTMDRINFRLRLPNWTLSVATLAGLGITNAAVDTTLDQAADVLKVDQNATDVNCCIDIQRTGTVATFAPPATMVNGDISNQAESDAVFAVNADIKIVNTISFCGQAGTYVGCADGNSIIVVNTFNPGVIPVFTDPSTVSHEVGHWSGLSHVAQTCTPTSGQCGTCTDCSDGFSNRVMYCRICAGAPNQGVITGAQCTSYQGAAQ